MRDPLPRVKGELNVVACRTDKFPSSGEEKKSEKKGEIGAGGGLEENLSPRRSAFARIPSGMPSPDLGGAVSRRTTALRIGRLRKDIRYEL